MLEKEGFDAWAEEYDRSVRETDEASGYPFAGYDALMSWLRQEITAEGSRSCGSYLDVGIGTGKLAGELYDRGFQSVALTFQKKCWRRLPGKCRKPG